MKFFDQKNKRLILFRKEATAECWDEHWQGDDLIDKIRAGKNNRLVRKFTFKFLEPGSKILEGGCGIGQNIYGLKTWGYDAFGVDFAPKTVEKIKINFPELKVFLQDVRKLDFPDNFFDGYWSLGVIEHFWEGYDEVLREAKRVIRPGGYLFLTFPYMSLLRNLKARLKFYKSFQDDFQEKNFYQFILDKEKAKKDIEGHGFKLVFQHPFDATKGLKDEVIFFEPILRRIYASQNVVARGIRFLDSILFSKIASHMILLVFQKNEK